MSAVPSASPAGLASAHAPALDLPARFLALGVLMLAGVGVSAPWTLPLLLDGFYTPRLLAFVHVNTLGVIGAIILGASYQLVPVVLQTELASTRLARLSFWCYLGGLIGLPLGLLRSWLPGLAVGGSLLTLAFFLYIAVVATTLRRAPRRDVVAWHLGVALVGLLGGVTYGFILAFNREFGFLGGSTLENLAAHAVLMLGGWVAVLLVGVAYRLVGMFTLAEDALWLPGAWLELAATAGGAWLLSTNLHLGGPRPVNIAGALLLLAGLLLFLGQLLRLYHRRHRRGIDVHMPFVLTAAGFGIGAAALVTIGFVTERPPSHPVWVAAGWLAIAGLAETAIQGFFYKISTFLTWLHRYAPVAGRQPVPRLDSLYHRRLALAGWLVWTTAIALQTAATLAGDRRVSVLAGVLLAAGLACFFFNVIGIGRHWLAAPTGPAVRLAGIGTTERANGAARAAATALQRTEDLG